MNKKLIAVAVAGAFGVPAAAFAQSSTVQIYGTLNVNYGYYDNGGVGFTSANPGTTTAGAQKLRYDAMNNSESEWGLKGEEALGGGMAAWFQCNTTLDAWSAGAANMCGRNSALGLKSGIGNVFIGNWDTPSKVMIGNFRPFAVANPNGLGSMFNGSSSDKTNTTDTFGFSRRQNRLITYISPTWNGLEFTAGYSAANESSAATAASTIQKPRLYSFALNYANGPLLLGASYERHIDYNPLSAGGATPNNPAGAGFSASVNQTTGAITGATTAAGAGSTYTGGRDASWQLAAAYTFMGTLKVSAIYVNMQYQNNTSNPATTGDLTQNNYGLFADWAVSGPHRLRAGWINAGSTKGSLGSSTAAVTIGCLTGNGGTGNTGGTKLIFEYAYALSKRTELNLGYSRQNNDRSANFTVGTGANTPNFGETQTYYGLRMKHSF
jgi:predicted porin